MKQPGVENNLATSQQAITAAWGICWVILVRLK